MRHNWHHVIEEIQPPIRNYVTAAIAATYLEAEQLNNYRAKDRNRRTNNLITWLNSWTFKQYIEGLGDCVDTKAREIYEVVQGGAPHIRALLQEHEAQEQELDKRDSRRWAKNSKKSNGENVRSHRKRRSSNTMTG